MKFFLKQMIEEYLEERYKEGDKVKITNKNDEFYGMSGVVYRVGKYKQKGYQTVKLSNGKVVSYDNRDDFIKHAMKNLKTAKLDKYVTTKIKDITQGIDERDLNAIILDIPNPCEAVAHAWKALKLGGYLCVYSPLISQVEKTFKEIKKQNFIEIKTLENIQREMIVSDYGTRPSFEMLGHTGYLTFARKVL